MQMHGDRPSYVQILTQECLCHIEILCLSGARLL